MLLAQINRDSQGMAEFTGGGSDGHVTLCLTEAVTGDDGESIDTMEGVSLQAVTLSDGSTAYIQHNAKDGKLMEGQVIQLEDGSAAYVQHVPKNDSLHLEDGQAVQLEDGTTAYIHHSTKDSYDQSSVQAVQLEDGTTAYIHHAVQVPQPDTILAIQADGTVAGLHTAEATIDPDTISALEHYAAKVSIEGSDNVSSSALMAEAEQEKKMQIVLQGHGPRVTAKPPQTNEKAFRCDYEGCGKLYTTAHHLKVHERSHTGDRPYQCEHGGCGKAFATGYGLKSHVRTHTGEKPYRCTEENCIKSFKTSGDLQKHIRTHTAEDLLKSSQITYVTGVRGEDGIPTAVAQSGQQLALIAQDGTQHVAIVAQDLSAFHAASAEMVQQQHGHHLVTTESRPVTLLATSNGTQIAVTLGEQQSLEEAIRIASRIQQGESPGLDE
ncbi:zinc finger protein 143 isoform X3 [Ranitomeya variabilis]|uniref:zinc finger protein 143 isoform X3 n=1 Tax=Ranitomeya variabilis TaxID=490064 RepID=UPI00405721AB